jgi:thioester reductase-like protein
MAAAIKHQDVSDLSPSIDWDVETKMEPKLHLTRTASPLRSSFAAGEGVVILTGSTGFLGREILRQLVHHSKVTKIYCIALRNPIDQKSPKIEKFRGDLTLPLLGLDEENAQRIFSNANIVIHNAADVSFLKTYHSLKTANLTSTKELVTLVAKYGTGTRFHYVSTAGVSQLIDSDVLEQSSVSSSKPPTNGSNGYVATKWASERFLEKASETIHLPVVIHRPSSVYGNGAPSSDIMQNLLRLSRQLKVVPALDFWKGYIDLVSVRKVSEGILSHALEKETVEVTEYVHQSGEIEIPVRELRAHLQKESGEEFETVSPEEWVKRAKVLGLDELVASYMLSRNGGVDLKTPRIGK